MSADNSDTPDESRPDWEDHDSERVLDEEGSVDAKIKQRILNSREAINENENVLFTQRQIMPEVQISHAQAVIAWGHTVRRFIRDVEPLLLNDEIPESTKYYEEVELGKVTVAPPDKNGYEFSRFTDPNANERHLKQQMGLPHDADMPEPYTEYFTGLKSVIEAGDWIGHTWYVYVDKTGAPEEWKQVKLEAAQPIDKEIYERAVRYTDRFLQNAGIGIETGTPEVYDDSAEPW